MARIYTPRVGFLDTSSFRRFAADIMQKVLPHSGATKFHYVIEGEGTLTIGDVTRTLGPGDIAWSAPDE